MRFRAGIALLLFVTACAASAPAPQERVSRNPRLANLQRAATLPWKDGGRCVVREASQPWPMLAERCLQALDRDRVKFHDTTGRCSVASTEAAALGLELCLLAAPEIVVGALIVMGVVVVGVAIKEALDTYELRGSHSGEDAPMPPDKPALPKHAANQEPAAETSGHDRRPPAPAGPFGQERRRCEPIPVPHRGGDDAHDKCADTFPPNRYPGKDVLVNGKRFDALQVGANVLWEIKTDQFETYSLFRRNQVVSAQVEDLRNERDIAAACGYGFFVGVSTAMHRHALLRQDRTLDIAVTGCKR